jgi:hypothetical protein
MLEVRASQLIERLREEFINAASMFGPHTQTDRGTCPGVGF